MKKWIFTDVCDRLKQQVPALRWIDAQEGQLSTNERPAVAFPCCLIDMAYIRCETLSGGKQKVTVQISLQVSFQSFAQTNANAPVQVRDKALERLDVMEEIHAALGWWGNNMKFTPMMRKRVTAEKRVDGLKVFNAVYETVFLD